MLGEALFASNLNLSCMKVQTAVANLQRSTDFAAGVAPFAEGISTAHSFRRKSFERTSFNHQQTTMKVLLQVLLLLLVLSVARVTASEDSLRGLVSTLFGAGRSRI